MAFEDWKRSITGPPGHPTHRSKLDKLRLELQEKLRFARSDTARSQWKRRIAAVNELLLGPAIADEPAPTQPRPKAATAPKPAPMSPAQMQAAWKASKEQNQPKNL